MDRPMSRSFTVHEGGGGCTRETGPSRHVSDLDHETQRRGCTKAMDESDGSEIKDMEEGGETSSDEEGPEVSEEDTRSMALLQSELQKNPLQYDKHLEVRFRGCMSMNCLFCNVGKA